MSGSWAKLLPLPLLVAALGAIYANPYPLLNNYAGRLADAKPQFTHANHGPLNNDKCWTNSGSSDALMKRATSLTGDSWPGL